MARGEKDKNRLGQGVYKQWGKAKEGFNVISNQFSVHYFFSDVNSINEFARNCSQNCRIDGYVIGTCYDGGKIFDRLKTKAMVKKYFIWLMTNLFGLLQKCTIILNLIQMNLV